MGRWRSALFVVISFSILLYFSSSILDAFSVRDTPSYVSRSAWEHGDPSEFGLSVGNGTYFENEVNNKGLFILKTNWFVSADRGRFYVSFGDGGCGGGSDGGGDHRPPPYFSPVHSSEYYFSLALPT